MTECPKGHKSVQGETDTFFTNFEFEMFNVFLFHVLRKYVPESRPSRTR